MTLVSHAQNFEDVMLWRALCDVQNGRYVDIGAQDPVVDSVSLAFYEAGWRGIHVEPSPNYAAELRKARPDETVIEAAVTDAVGPIEFFEVPGTGISTGVSQVADLHRAAGFTPRKIFAPTVRLNELLTMANGDVHWMKIDVEGMEPDVLRSWGDSPVRPWLLVIEATAPGSQVPTHEAWIDEVTRRGYTQVHFDGLSRWFVHEDHADLSERLTVPANVFDRFAITPDHFSASALRSQRDELDGRLGKEQARSVALKAALDDARQGRDHELDQHRNTLQQLAAAERAHRAAQDDLQSQLHKAQADRDAAIEQHLGALRRVAEVEQEWRSGIDALWREFQDNDRKLRAEFADRERALQADLRDAHASLASARADLARTEGRAEQVRHELTAALQRAQEFQLQLTRSDEAMRESQRKAMASEQELRAHLDAALVKAEQHGDLARRAEALISAAAAERPGRWQRFGEAVGVARRGEAIRALEDWRPVSGSPIIQPQAERQSMTAMPIIRTTPPSEQRNPYLRANSLTELLAWDDADFVRCAYVTVLGRQPDWQGESYYTNRIRRGHLKQEVLWQLRHSPEGPAHDPGIKGFDRALKLAAWSRKPIVGAIVRILYGMDGDGTSDRHHRMMMNELARLRAELAAPMSQPGLDELRNEIRQLAHRINSQSADVESSSVSVAPIKARPCEAPQGAAYKRLTPRAQSIYRQLAPAGER